MKFVITVAAMSIMLVMADAFKDRMEVVKTCKEKSGANGKVLVFDKTCDIDKIENDKSYPVYLDCLATNMGFMDKDKNIDKEKLYQYKIEVEKLDPELAKKISEGCSDIEGAPEKKSLNLRKCVCKQLN